MCSACRLSQVTGDKHSVAQMQAGLWHLQFPVLLHLYLMNVLSTVGLLPAPPGNHCWCSVFSHMLVRMGGSVLSLLPVSLSPAVSCCAARGPLRSWHMYTGKPFTRSGCKGSECCICCFQALLEKSVAGGEAEGKILPSRIQAARC